MPEKCLTFGAERNLQGILCEPVPGRRRQDAPAVLMWNVGALHRVGPYRMNVELARRMAAAGYVSLRFDLAGLGDSTASRSGRLTRESAVVDVRQAMDCLEARGDARRFVLVGHCSSADHAHRAAVADARVCAAAMIDGYSYVTRQSRMRRYASFLARPARVRNLLRRFGARWRGDKVIPSAEEAFAWEMPSRAQAAAELQALVDRDVKLLYVFAGEFHGQHNYAGQFRDMYHDVDMRGRVQSHFWADCDHIFSRINERRRLITLIETWVREQFGG